MASKNDEKFIAFCDEIKAYVEEHQLAMNIKIRISIAQVNSEGLQLPPFGQWVFDESRYWWMGQIVGIKEFPIGIKN